MESGTATAQVASEAAAGRRAWPEPEWLQRIAGEPGLAWVRTHWHRAAATEGAWFDHAKADAVVRLWPKLFRLTEDRFATKPFHLLPWQEAIVRLLVGWKVPVEVLDPETHAPQVVQVRLYRRLLLWLPRKNGKSEFLSALALLFWAIEGTYAGQGYVFARNEKQGKIPFDKMTAMVAMSPPLSTRVRAFKRSLWIPQIRAAVELLSGKPEGKHGRSPTVILGDEMHEWESDELASTLRQGTGARLEPIELYASTAGLKSNATGYALWEESLAILEGRIDDPTTLVVVFAAGADDDWADENVWAKANPSLGLSPTVAYLRGEAAKAKDSFTAEARFRRYHLNQWVETIARWLDLKKWDACAPDREAWKRYAAELKGRACVAALDVSSNEDITSLTWLFLPDGEDDVLRAVCRFWCPQEQIERRARRDRVTYDRWRELGAIEETPGDYVDQAFVQKALLDGLNDYDVKLIGFDPWNARKLYTDLVNEGVDERLFLEMRMGHKTLGEPSKAFENLVKARRFDHGGHPVLRWMAGHAEVRFDENMNFVPAKKRSRDKIDGIVTAVMATGLTMAIPESGLDDFLDAPVMVA